MPGTISLDGVASSDDDDAGDTRDNTAVVYERAIDEESEESGRQTDWHKGTEPSERLTHERKIVEQFQTWEKRDLSETTVVYMILDAVRLGVRRGTREKEAVLVAWGFLEDGSRELIGVMLGNSESYGSWKGFLDDLLARG